MLTLRSRRVQGDPRSRSLQQLPLGVELAGRQRRCLRLHVRCRYSLSVEPLQCSTHPHTFQRSRPSQTTYRRGGGVASWTCAVKQANAHTLCAPCTCARRLPRASRGALPTGDIGCGAIQHRLLRHPDSRDALLQGVCVCACVCACVRVSCVCARACACVCIYVP